MKMMKLNYLVKILMVDDRPENLFSLEVILSNENYQCVKANSGEEALKILSEEQNFAIILMDVQMPGIDGFETVEQIRKIEKLKHIPVIFLTASMDDSSQIFKGYQVGAVDYMIKPLSSEILKAKVSIFVDLYKKNQELLFQKEQMKELNSNVSAQKMLSKYALSLIEASHDPLFAINTEGKITDLNSASVKIIGSTRKKIIGDDFFNYFTEVKTAKNLYQKTFVNGSIVDFPLIFKDKKGKLTPVLFNGSIYKGDKENIQGIVIVARDVTEQKRNENELIKAKSKAENATKIANDAVKAKQQFLSNMSHEIRTPMNAIIGFTKVVLKTELTDKQKEYLEAIKTSGDALIVLINDILDLAKVDAGKMSFEEIPFKMGSSISSMLHLFETKIQEKNLDLIKVYDKNIPEVLLGDPVRLHQIILNLISNAVKFTNHGEITVSVRLLHEDENKVTIEFAVEDTGIGIPQTKISSIFENFQQATSGTSRVFGGTGLGLAIVKQLVEPQGGQIEVKSKLNSGSVFSFTLPFLKTEEKALIESDEIEKSNLIKNIKVLVVEDIALNQLLMKTLLDDFGFELEIASNGKIAIDKLENKVFDIILMDLQMPIMNGFEATEYIRNKMNSNIPIIALTADVTTADIDKCRAVGMNDYIAKPVDERILYNKMISLVQIPKKDIPDKKQQMIAKHFIKNGKTSYIDLSYLTKRTKSNPILMKEMIEMYLEQTPQLIDSMQKGLKTQDWDLLKSTVHKMIPSFSIMGIHTDYEKMAKTIQEYASIKQNFDDIDSMVKQLEEVCIEACRELENELLELTKTTWIQAKKIFLVDDDSSFLKSLELEFLGHGDFEMETYPRGEKCLENFAKRTNNLSSIILLQ